MIDSFLWTAAHVLRLGKSLIGLVAACLLCVSCAPFLGGREYVVEDAYMVRQVDGEKGVRVRVSDWDYKLVGDTNILQSLEVSVSSDVSGRLSGLNVWMVLSDTLLVVDNGVAVDGLTKAGVANNCGKTDAECGEDQKWLGGVCRKCDRYEFEFIHNPRQSFVVIVEVEGRVRVYEVKHSSNKRSYYKWLAPHNS